MHYYTTLCEIWVFKITNKLHSCSQTKFDLRNVIMNNAHIRLLLQMVQFLSGSVRSFVMSKNKVGLRQGRRHGFKPGWANILGKIRHEAPKKIFCSAHPGFQFAHPGFNNTGGQRPSCDNWSRHYCLPSCSAYHTLCISVCLYNHFQLYNIKCTVAAVQECRVWQVLQ